MQYSRQLKIGKVRNVSTVVIRCARTRRIQSDDFVIGSADSRNDSSRIDRRRHERKIGSSFGFVYRIGTGG